MILNQLSRFWEMKLRRHPSGGGSKLAQRSQDHATLCSRIRGQLALTPPELAPNIAALFLLPEVEARRMSRPDRFARQVSSCQSLVARPGALALLVIALAWLPTTPAAAITQTWALYWTGNGTWDNGTVAKWADLSGGDPPGTYNMTWAAGRTAFFEGTPGSVTVASGGVSSVSAITCTTDGYMFTGTGAVTLTGTGGNITTGAGTDTINSPLAGSVGLSRMAPAP